MNISLELPPLEWEKLYRFLKERGFSFKNIDYAFFRAENNSISITFYKSGKLLIQGREIDEIYNLIRTRFFKSKNGIWLGTDEAGKGDYFGPLVVAGVVLKPEKEDKFLRLGIKDSKRLSSARIAYLAEEIKKLAVYNIEVISPEEYNKIYEEVGNLNKILSMFHIKVIEKLIDKTGAKIVVVDKFSKNSGISGYLNGKVKVEEIEKGERDIACAAASILARYSFVEYIEKMHDMYKFIFPKGAGKKVKDATLEFVQKYSLEELKYVAKLHFKLTEEIIHG